MKRAKILLVDDHTFITELLMMSLGGEPCLEIITWACDAKQAIAKARRHAPDMIITDIEMPGLSIFDALCTIRLFLPRTSIIFLSAHTTDHYIQQALDLEARAYLTKDEPLENLIHVIKNVASGGCYFSPGIQSRLVITSKGLRLGSFPRIRGDLLTGREKQVLGYVGHGLSKKEMADLMIISVKTVENHCSHMMAKLDIHDRVQLARYAIQEGFSPL